jgi:hypothetical protein
MSGMLGVDLGAAAVASWQAYQERVPNRHQARAWA